MDDTLKRTHGTRFLVWVLLVIVLFAQPLQAQPIPRHPDAGAAQQTDALMDSCFRQPPAAALAACKQVATLLENAATAPAGLALKVNDRLEDILWELRRYEEAEVLARAALKTIEASQGKLSAEKADRLGRLATVLQKEGKLEEAELLLRQEVAIEEQLLGKDDLTVANSLNNLAWVIKDRKMLVEAESLLRRALAINEAAHGKVHADVAVSLVNLAWVLQDQGKLENAEVLLRRALSIKEEVRGKYHRDVATALGNLASVLLDRGKLEEAEPLLRRAIAIDEKALGKDDPAVAAFLGNLARGLSDRGKPEEAEPLLRRALAIMEASFGKEHREVAISLGNLALALHDQGRPGEAEPLFRRALAINESTWGPNHPRVALTLLNLALLLKAQDKLREAELLLRRAISIDEQALGKDHPIVATALNNLAGVFFRQGRHEEAAHLLGRTLAIRQLALGKDHLLVATTYANLAKLKLARRPTDDMVDDLRQAVQIFESVLNTSPTEDYAAGLLREWQAIHRGIYGLPLLPSRSEAAVQLAVRTALLNKSRTLETGMLVRRALQSGQQTNAQRDLYLRMQELLDQRAHILSQPSMENSKKEAARKLLWEAQEIEQTLARSAGIRSNQSLPGMQEIVERVAAKLPQDSALIELVIGEQATFPDAPDSRPAAELHYIALILFPDRKVQAFDLGIVEQVHSAVAGWLGELEIEPPSARYGAQSNQSFERVTHKSRTVYDQIFRSMDGVLRAKAVRRLIVAADGILNAVPWGALHDGTQYLIDRYSIQYVSSGRDVLREHTSYSSQPAVVLAAADAPGQRRLQQAREAAPLLAQALRGRLLSGAMATEQSLSESVAPYALALISHGIFQDGRFAQTGMLARVPRRSAMPNRLFAESLVDSAPRIKLEELWDVDEAMHRSALALMPGEQSKDSRQDGWLTAEEVRELKLRGTQLVLLLACQSGRGGLSFGQGVYGLRRAFLQADAETVVSSLWSIDEASATELIKRYVYKLTADPRKGRFAAMEDAMKELRSQERYRHPFYWAPFVVTGADGPLRLPTR